MRSLAASLVLVVLLLAQSGYSQNFDTLPDARTGRVPFVSYVNSNLESATFFNGNLAPDITLFAIPGRELRKSTTSFDRLHRPVQVKLWDPDGHVFADTVYDGDGRVKEASQPYRSGSPIWTETVYNGLGRPRKVLHPDGSAVSADYVDNTVATIDEAGNWSRSTFNALGQLTKVEEPLGSPIVETTYAYYAFGPLKTVYRGGQTHSFTHDLLGRLLSEQHPEQDYATTYSSDDNPSGGRIDLRTDALGIVTSYTYDALDRLTTIGYADSTPDVALTYDHVSGGANDTGLLRSEPLKNWSLR